MPHCNVYIAPREPGGVLRVITGRYRDFLGARHRLRASSSPGAHPLWLRRAEALRMARELTRRHGRPIAVPVTRDLPFLDPHHFHGGDR